MRTMGLEQKLREGLTAVQVDKAQAYAMGKSSGVDWDALQHKFSIYHPVTGQPLTMIVTHVSSGGSWQAQDFASFKEQRSAPVR